uniref:Lipocalin-like domain-containing protein n=1 Tax=Candidatus Kentrum sp. DK TaxID=2126562 RepID=A0A450SRZ9_9GAMM|nr:MAG: Lipocalin-like domain-containing protein [Candidatus Kentron sp. DK]
MDKNPFIGTWKLISFEGHPENGEIFFPLGQKPTGTLMYDDRCHMSVIILSGERPPMSTPHKWLVPQEEKAAAFDSFDAYFGAYAIDEKEMSITHHLQGALSPNWADTQQKRFYTFSGDENQLELRTPPLAYTEQQFVGILKWERL